MSTRYLLDSCPDCGAEPGMVHDTGECDVERCSVCGQQYLSCGHVSPSDANGDPRFHDPTFARWSGFWPGSLEADSLGIDLNAVASDDRLVRAFFIKPEVQA